MWEAWVAPDGGAVSLSVQVMKVEARWLRRARPRPFGFAADSPHPTPARIGEAHGSGTVSSGLATVLGLRTAVWTMSIFYGDVTDHSVPAVRIISDFHRPMQDRDLEVALVEAAGEWPGPRAWPDATAGPGRAGGTRAGGTRAEVTSETAEVVVSGTAGPVHILRLGEMSAFQFRREGVLVTVLARHLGSEFPDIVRLADLGPMISGLEHPDREAIAAAFAEKRRRQIEKMRSQTGHNA